MLNLTISKLRAIANVRNTRFFNKQHFCKQRQA